MNALDYLANVLHDYCTLHKLEYLSADDLLWSSRNELTANQEEWLSCYITTWDLVSNSEVI